MLFLELTQHQTLFISRHPFIFLHPYFFVLVFTLHRSAPDPALLTKDCIAQYITDFEFSFSCS